MLCKELCEDLRRKIETSIKQHKRYLSQSPACTEAIKFINPMSKKYWQLIWRATRDPRKFETLLTTMCIYIYTSNHIIKKISVEKSKWNVALSHLEELRFSTLEQRRGTFSLASLYSSLKVMEKNYESEGL